MRVKLFIVTLAIAGSFCLGGCSLFFLPRDQTRGLVRGKVVWMETTAYCPCGICCGWKLDKFGRPVIAKGRNRGKSKAVGITASGTRARPGTLAADTRYYPFGSVMYIPGYGYGIVEDRGGDIKGRKRLDLFFHTHQEARNWGRQKVRAVVFPKNTPPLPKNAPPPR